MKRIISIFLTLLFLITIIGCNKPTNKNDKNSSEQESDISSIQTKTPTQEKVEEPLIEETKTLEDTQKENTETKTPTQEKVEEPSTEEVKIPSTEKVEIPLTKEDEKLKSEIAKYSDTNVDFRFEKKEKFEGKEYNFKFSRMGCISSKSLTSNITYVSDNGDEVSYDLETGNMTMAYFRSLESQKGANSIDITQAEKTAYHYAAKNCDIAQYVLEEKEERDNGYMIAYCKQICGYRTNDRVRILVGFDGSIVWTTIRLNAIDDKLNVDKSWFEERIKELENPDYDTTIEDAWIERDEDNVYFCVKNTAKNLTTNTVSASVQRFEIK